MSWEVFIFDKSEFASFVCKLDRTSKARLARDISMLKEKGPDLRMPLAKKIDKNLWELRISGKQRVRVIYSIRGRRIVVVNWFIKKSQKIPAWELRLAIKRLTKT